MNSHLIEVETTQIEKKKLCDSNYCIIEID